MKHTNAEPPPPGATHEKRDTNIRIVLISGVALAGLVVFTLLLVSWVNRYIIAGEPVRESVPPALMDSRPPQVSGPRVRAEPRVELVSLRKNEDARLTGYGRDPLTGAIHIPVEQAMQRVLAQGLPVRPGGTATQPAQPPAGRVNTGKGQD